MHEALNWLVVLFSFLFGINVGSFLNVCVYRSPRHCVTVNHPVWSFCPRCRRRLRWYENQPLLGWLLLRGKCGGCALPISLRYPLIEGLTGLLWLGVAWRTLLPVKAADPTAAFVLVTAVSMILVAALIDLDLRILPDKLTIPGMVLTPIGMLFAPSLIEAWNLPQLSHSLHGLLVGPLSWWGSETLVWLYTKPLSLLLLVDGGPRQAAIEALLTSLAGLVTGVSAMWGLALMGRVVTGREAIGFGDVKFLGFLGALTGPGGVLILLVLASAAGSVAGLWGKFLSGRSVVSEDRLDAELGLLGRVLLRPFGVVEPAAPGDPEGEPRRRFRGPPAWLCRFFTGDATVPFGPALGFGAFLVLLAPVRPDRWLVSLLGP